MVTAAWRLAAGVHLGEAEMLSLRDTALDFDKPQAARRSGTMASRQPGSGLDLREVRSYVPGDDLRRLDPSATARTGRPHVRALNEDRDDVTLLIADFRPEMLWGTSGALRSVRAARYVASLGWRAVLRGGVVGLVIAEAGGVRSLMPATGDAQMSALCRMLAHRHAEALAAKQVETSLAEALAVADRIAPGGAEIRLASLPGGWKAAEVELSRLARGRRVGVDVILDPIEVMPPVAAMPLRNRGRQHLARLPQVDVTAHAKTLQSLGVTGREVAP